MKHRLLGDSKIKPQPLTPQGENEQSHYHFDWKEVFKREMWWLFPAAIIFLMTAVYLIARSGQ